MSERSRVRVRAMRAVQLACIGFAVSTGVAQNSSPVAPPAGWSADQDHQNMMEQLGIERLRPGPSGDEHAPNHANYDESLANPFPQLPDVLTLRNGKKVTTREMWWNERRPEIVDDMEREVYGRLPNHLPKVSWRVTVTDKEIIGRNPVLAQQLVGHVDNSAHPLIQVDISMTLVTPLTPKARCQC